MGKNAAMNERWDIFCRVVDNYGDAGVCWRLARQLADEFHLVVRLWIDDLSALKKIQPAIDISQTQQISAGVVICYWSTPLPQPVQAADIVIEAFACEIPADYRVAMRQQHSLWINLEYLSAEDWVAGCHGLPSPQSAALPEGRALKKYFFFPGFQDGTGGVPGERDLPQQRDSFQADAGNALNFFARPGFTPPPGALRISLFAYRYAPIENVLQVWTAHQRPIICFVPEGQPLAAVSQFFGEELAVGSVRERGALTLVVLPFMSQTDYDRLLWSCDINFVRGEDSFVRAQWAARPFVWQIYAQEEGAHWPKLDAFIKLYGEYTASPSMAALRDFWHAWNGDGNIADAWAAYIDALPRLDMAAKKWAGKLECGTNLAAALVQFCANRV